MGSTAPMPRTPSITRTTEGTTAVPTAAAITTRRRRRVRAFALPAAAAALALAASACGSSSNSASGSSTTTAAGSTSSASTSATSGSSATSGATTGGAAGNAAPGVTASTVTVGSVAVLGGPVPGLFQGAPFGAEAYFAYINSQGGVNGRQIKLNSYDDSLNCQNNQNAFANNLNKVFAFVGSMSVVDNCGAKVLAANPTVSSIAFQLTPQSRTLPNAFDPEPQPQGYRLGGFEWYKQNYPKDMKVGGIYSAASGSSTNFNAQMAAMKSLGYKIEYTRAFQPTETSFTSDILRMKNSGVNFLWVTDDDIGTIARLVNEAKQQDWNPLIVSGDTAYDSNLPKLLGNSGAGNGILTDQLTAMFLGEDRSTVPAVNNFLTWMTKTHPGFKPDLYSVWGWADAELFVDALKAAGPQPTRASLLAALKNVHSFDASGLMAQSDPGNHKPSNCYVVIKYNAGKWSRVTPATGFQCNPGGYYYYSGS